MNRLNNIPNLITGVLYNYPDNTRGSMFYTWVCWLIDVHVDCDVASVLKNSVANGAH